MVITLLITAIYVILIKIFFNAEKILLWIKQRTNKEDSQLTTTTIYNLKMASLVSFLVITVVYIITFFSTNVE